MSQDEGRMMDSLDSIDSYIRNEFNNFFMRMLQRLAFQRRYQRGELTIDFIEEQENEWEMLNAISPVPKEPTQPMAESQPV